MSLQAGYRFSPPCPITNTLLNQLFANATLGRLSVGNFVEGIIDGPDDVPSFRSSKTAAFGDHDHSLHPIDGANINTASIPLSKLNQPVPATRGGMGFGAPAASGQVAVIFEGTGFVPVLVAPTITGLLTVDYNNLLLVTVEPAPAFIAEAPVPSIAGGTYNTPQSVTLSTTTPGASIAYTLDGSTPAVSGSVITNGLLYSGAVNVDPDGPTVELAALAFAAGWQNSTIVLTTYIFNTEAPIFNPAAGDYAPTQTIAISCTTPNATIVYTTDGSTPTRENGTVYSSPVELTDTITLSAFAYSDGYNDSTITTGDYTVDSYNQPGGPGQTATPTFSPDTNTYNSPQTVTISCATVGATIYFTTDGSTPTTNSAVYLSSQSIDPDVLVTGDNPGIVTVKALAVAAGHTNSHLARAIYTFQSVLPTVSVSGGTYTDVPPYPAFTLTVGCPDGYVIAFTTDGSTPNGVNDWSLNNGDNVPSYLFGDNGTTDLKMVALKLDPTQSFATYLQSAVLENVYVITYAPPDAPTVLSPTGSAPAQNFVYVNLTGPPNGHEAYRWTDDGSDPTSSHGNVYTGPAYHYGAQYESTYTFKAVAYNSGWGSGTSSVVAVVVTVS